MVRKWLLIFIEIKIQSHGCKGKSIPQQSLEGGIKIPSNEIRTNSGKYKKHSPCSVFLIQFFHMHKKRTVFNL